MGNKYLEVGKEEGKRYVGVYLKDGDEEWNKGFDDIEEAVKFAKETLEREGVGGFEVCDVKTQQDLLVYDLDTGKVRETDMRETIKKGKRMKFTFVRKGEPFGNKRVKAHVGDNVEMQMDVKRGNLKKGMKGKVIAITNSRKPWIGSDIIDWFYRVEINGKDHWMMAGGTWEVTTGYKVKLTMDREPEFREYPDYEEARGRIVSLLQKGENGWNAEITGGGRSEFFERRGPGVVYQDGKIAKEEELTSEVLGRLFG